MKKETITISIEEYERLKDVEARFEALNAAGVDNWSGYGYAMSEIYNGDYFN